MNTLENLNPIILKRLKENGINLNYFSATGLSMSDANFKANVSKEFYSILEQEIANLQIIEETINYSGENLVLQSTTNFTIEEIIEKINKINKFKIFNAWVRAAIAEKERALSLVKNLQIDQLLTKEQFEIHNKRPIKGLYPNKPIKNVINENTIKADFSENDLYKYLASNTVAATLGEFIHPERKINNLLNDLKTFSQYRFQKLVISGLTNDVIVKRTTKYTIEEISSIFFTLQGMHREANKTKNYLIKLINDTLNIDTQTSIMEYQKNMVEFDKKVKEIEDKYIKEYSEYTSKIEEIHNKIEQERLQVIKYIADLKITILPELEEIINEIDLLISKK